MKFFASKRYQRVTNFALAFMLVVSTLTASVPFLFAEKADAAPSVSYNATPLVAADWSVDRAAPSGGWNVDAANGRIVLIVNQANSSADAFYKTEGIAKSLPANTDSIKASVFVASDWNTKPSLRAGLWGVASNGVDANPSYPIIEYANIGGYTGWRVWNANTGTWINVAAPTAAGNYTVEIVSNFNTGNYDFYVNNSKVYSYAAEGYTTFTNMIFNNYNVGDTTVAGSNYVVEWKNISTGSLPRVAACTTETSVVTTGLSHWDLSESRSQGSSTLTPSGLALKTVNNPAGNGSPDQRKAAGYYATDFALANAGTESIADRMTYTTVSGIAPGLQMKADFDNDGTIDAILVGEAVYGNDWWVSDSAKQFVKDNAPSHAGGSGSTNHGTLNAWLAAFPNARVKAIGYSLGSGVTAEGTINSLDFGCTTFTFALDTTSPSKPVLNLPSNGSALPTNDFDFDWNDSTDANALTYEFRSSQDPSNDGNGNLNGSNIWNSGPLPSSNLHSSGAPDGYWFYQVRAKDEGGNYSAWSDIWSVILDTKAPTTPVITYPGGWHQDVTNIQWNASVDTTAVTYNIYEGTHPNDVNTLVAENQTGTSFAKTFSTGPHQIRVVAKDAFGRTTSSDTVGFQVIGVPQITLPTEGFILTAVNGNAYTTTWTGVYGVGGTAGYEVEYGIDTNGNGSIQANELLYRNVSGDTLQRTQTFNTNFQGAMTIRVRAVYNIAISGSDKGPWSTVVNYSRDSIAPTAPLVTADDINSGESTNEGSVNIRWNTPSTDTATYDYRVWTNIVGDAYNGESNAYYANDLTENSRNGAFTQGEGTYFVQVRATDAVGNTSGWSNTFTVTYDATEPVITGEGFTQDANVFTPEFASDEDLTYVWTADESNPTGATFEDDVLNPDFTVTKDGDYEFTLIAKDAAGNSSFRTISFTYTAPVVAAPVDESNDDDNDIVATNDGTPAADTFTNIIIGATADQGVLGANTDDDASAAEVKGTSTDKTAAVADGVNNTDGKIFGLAWFWWLLIIAALAAIAWWIIGAIRRRNSSEA